MKRTLIATGAVCLLALAGCSDGEGAYRVLLANNYGDIQTHGFGWFSCGAGDFWGTRFDATPPGDTAPNARRVKGTVCKGWLKGSTIRFD